MALIHEAKGYLSFVNKRIIAKLTESHSNNKQTEIERQFQSILFINNKPIPFISYGSNKHSVYIQTINSSFLSSYWVEDQQRVNQ